jgi:hypothetical protein
MSLNFMAPISASQFGPILKKHCDKKNSLTLIKYCSKTESNYRKRLQLKTVQAEPKPRGRIDAYSTLRTPILGDTSFFEHRQMAQEDKDSRKLTTPVSQVLSNATRKSRERKCSVISCCGATSPSEGQLWHRCPGKYCRFVSCGEGFCRDHLEIHILNCSKIKQKE